ncbi:DUF5698 domain-containing protein [Salsipaludibacter albus]|uniref:DUF5698 domain-containing protein n=1 Tax=Salsipaludibacter albus TaxID=2849650 RepID=UPI001EE4A064|nr:DUF5698 domain-containing protein [Salsipaludibacter albus]MBY5161302.1 hypothetical protein [Salsipaludibacter albus]
MTLLDGLDVLGVATLATGNVGLWTFRVALASAGKRIAAATVAGVEALLFVLVFGTVLQALDDPLRVGAYAVGVGIGTLFGIVADERLAGGQSRVRLVLDGDATDARHRLHDLGWPVTTTPAIGVRGDVTVLDVVVDDRVLPHIAVDLEREAPDGFLTVERLRRVRAVPFPTAMHAVGTPRRLRQGTNR